MNLVNLRCAGALAGEHDPIQRTTATTKDWRRVIGIAGDSELMRQIDAEGQRIREAEREEARREPAE